MLSASRAGMLICHTCHAVVPQDREGMPCQRCHEVIHRRKPHSIAYTWAYLLTACVAMFPANLFPMMTVSQFGDGVPDTIFSGVIHLAEEGMYPIAVIVFIASIAVPVLKIAGLSLLLIVVQRRWRLSPHQSTLLYRMISFIGRWSMLDLFIIAILITLVDLGNLVSISTGPAATAFTTVVVFTLLAARSFDTRYLWDLSDE